MFLWKARLIQSRQASLLVRNAYPWAHGAVTKVVNWEMDRMTQLEFQPSSPNLFPQEQKEAVAFVCQDFEDYQAPQDCAITQDTSDFADLSATASPPS